MSKTGEIIATIDFKDDKEIKVNGKKLDDEKLKKRGTMMKNPSTMLGNPVSIE